MKRFSFVAALVALVVLTGRGEFLYWQVTDSMLQSDSYLKANVTGSADNYRAVLRYGTTGSDILQYTIAANDAVLADTTYTYATIGQAASVDEAAYMDISTLSDPTGYSFYIEIYNYDSSSSSITGDSIARSEVQTYTTLNGNNYIGSTLKPSVSAWTGGAYSAPEPSSGLLVMFALAMLGLRRKCA